MKKLIRKLRSAKFGVELSNGWNELWDDDHRNFLADLFLVMAGYDRVFVPIDEKGTYFKHRASVTFTVLEIALEVYVTWED